MMFGCGSEGCTQCAKRRGVVNVVEEGKYRGFEFESEDR